MQRAYAVDAVGSPRSAPPAVPFVHDHASRLRAGFVPCSSVICAFPGSRQAATAIGAHAPADTGAGAATRPSAARRTAAHTQARRAGEASFVFVVMGATLWRP